MSAFQSALAEVTDETGSPGDPDTGRDRTNSQGGSARVASGLSGASAIAKAWILLITGLVLNGWVWSLAGHLSDSTWTAVLIVLFSAEYLRRQLKRCAPEDLAWLKTQLLFPPFLMLLALFLLTGVLYPPVVHDTLTSRLPRILLWLQIDQVKLVPAANDQINFMPMNWELTAVPLVRIFGLHLLEWISTAAWVVCYVVFGHWIWRWTGGDTTTARWWALASGLPRIYVMQAAHTMTDLFLISFLLCSLWFLVRWEESRESWAILWSGLALAIAAGCKQHVALLALPWLLWFVLARSRPWRYVPWRWVPLMGAVALVMSPLPSFCLNQQFYGSWQGPPVLSELSHSRFWNLVAGNLQFALQSCAPPFFPVAGGWNAWVADWSANTPMAQHVPKFTLKLTELPLVDQTSLGTFFTIVVLLGLGLALRRWRRAPRWAVWGLGAGVFGFEVAVAMVVTMSLGRSYCAFVLLGAPLAFWGLCQLPSQWARRCGLALLLVSIFVLVLNPAHPLWPVGALERSLERRQASPALLSKVQRYRSFTQRGQCGAALVAQVPAQEKRLGAVVGAGDPLIHLWTPLSAKRQVQFYPPGATIDDLLRGGERYFVIGGGANELQGPLIEGLLQDPRFEIVADDSCIARLSAGPETWRLIRKRE